MVLKPTGLKATLLALTGWLCSAEATAEFNAKVLEQTHYPLGSQQQFTGPESLFTGDVQVNVLFPANEHASFSGAYVTFAPGARTAWHSHPAGQHIVVTEGMALTGTREGRVIPFGQGETVWCPPGIDHWHGATPHASMTHLVLTGVKDDKNVQWKEKVTDEQYLSHAATTNTSVTEYLTVTEQVTVPIAAYVTSGNLVALKQAINSGLDQGLSISEVKEIIIHLYPYVGFPRALNALATYQNVLAARHAEGKTDVKGQAANKVAMQDNHANGLAVQTALVGEPVSGPLFEFAPDMNIYLQRHLFGDVFSRGVLDHRERELITVAGLSHLPGTDAQLEAHIQMATHAGVTRQELQATAAVLSTTVGNIPAQRVNNAIINVLSKE